MTAPVPGSTLVVRPDEVAAFGAELAALAAELAVETFRCRAAGSPLATSLSGDEGWSASVVAGTWALLLEAIAARTEALGVTLVGIAEAYRCAEAVRADRIPAYLIDQRSATPR